MTAPERISISPTYNQKHDDDYYLVDRAAFPGKGIEYVHDDLADAAVAAAYERAVELACERLADSWTWDDADFLSCVIADLKRHVIESGPTQKAKAALEAVRREARAEALREAAEIAYAYIGPEMGSLFYQGINSGCRAIKSRISALIDKETTE